MRPTATAPHELIAAQRDRRFPFCILLDHDRRDGIGQRGDQHEALTVPLHGKVQCTAACVNEHDTGKTRNTAEQLGGGHALLTQDDGRNQDGEKDVRRDNDRRLDA